MSGDEILAVNGSILHGLSHDEAIAIFKRIRSGPVVMQVGRRTGAAMAASAVTSSGGARHYSTMGRPPRKPLVPPSPPKLVSKNSEGYLQ